jgi:shikimate kinase
MTRSAAPDILLIGLRGSGKSTLARTLGERFGIQAIDLDPLVLARLGCSTVAQAWARHSEPGFRAAEARTLTALLADQESAHPAPSPSKPPHNASSARAQRVIALGGGTPTVPVAQLTITNARTNGTARVAYLHAPPGVLAARLPQDDPDRPTLTDAADPIAEIQRVYTARDPLYRQLADLVIESTTLDAMIAWLAPWLDENASPPQHA